MKIYLEAKIAGSEKLNMFHGRVEVEFENDLIPGKGDILDLMGFLKEDKSNLVIRSYGVFDAKNELNSKDGVNYESLASDYLHHQFAGDMQEFERAKYREEIFEHGRYQVVKDKLWKHFKGELCLVLLLGKKD